MIFNVRYHKVLTIFLALISVNFIVSSVNGYPQIQKKVPPEIDNVARQIIVKISNRKSLGKYSSGVIVSSSLCDSAKKTAHLVITNQHVVSALNKQANAVKDYLITPYDDSHHQAKSVSLGRDVNIKISQGSDVSFFVFISDKSYKSARINPKSISLLKNGNPIYLAGFPCDDSLCDGQPLVNYGELGLQEVLKGNKIINGGYQLGFTNDNRNGMSGGAILDGGGDLVGINGRGQGQTAIWDNDEGNPFQYTDGSLPPKSLQDKMYDLSWGIPFTKEIIDIQGVISQFESTGKDFCRQITESKNVENFNNATNYYPTQINNSNYDYKELELYLTLIGVLISCLLVLIIFIKVKTLNSKSKCDSKASLELAKVKKIWDGLILRTDEHSQNDILAKIQITVLDQDLDISVKKMSENGITKNLIIASEDVCAYLFPNNEGFTQVFMVRVPINLEKALIHININNKLIYDNTHRTIKLVLEKVNNSNTVIFKAKVVEQNISSKGCQIEHLSKNANFICISYYEKEVQESYFSSVDITYDEGGEIIALTSKSGLTS